MGPPPTTSWLLIPKMNLFIPIKHDSQRVPGKNFRVLPNGKPLWLHTIEKFSDFSLYVDTDSDILLEQLSEYSHVSAYSRMRELTGHAISVCELIKHSIKKFALSGPLGQIHVTSPLLIPTTVRSAFRRLDHHDSVASCTQLQNRLWRQESYGYCPINHNPLKLEETQALPPYYEENSAFYIFDCKAFYKSSSRIGNNPYFYPVGFPESLDIDTESDWDTACDLLRID